MVLLRRPESSRTQTSHSCNVVLIVEGDYVAISASRFPFPTVLKQKEAGDWFDSISRTLNWNERKRQKKFDDPADGKE